MAFGVTAPGPLPGAPAGTAGPGRYRTRESYLDAMRDLVAQGNLDIVLTSASNGERLAADGSLDDDVTLAVRANDTTDIWNSRGSNYPTLPVPPVPHRRPGRGPAVLRPGALLGDLQQRPGPRPGHPAGVPRVPDRGRRARGCGTSSRCSTPTRRSAWHAGAGRRLRQRLDRPHAGRGDPGAAAAVPEDGLQRRGRAGRAGRARPVGGGRHPRRLGRHHPGHLRAAAPGRAQRRSGRAVRPQDPARGVPAGPGRPDAAGAARRADARPTRCGPTTRRWPRPRSPRSARSTPTSR